MYDGTWFPSAVFKYNIVSMCLKKKKKIKWALPRQFISLYLSHFTKDKKFSTVEKGQINGLNCFEEKK